MGKSIVTSMLAVLMQRKGYNAAIMDLDITDPLFPGRLVSNRESGDGDGLNPVVSETGIR